MAILIMLRFMHRSNVPLALHNVQQMEKFKACEKEMKTKAFSKEGLTQSIKLDAKAQEKLEVTQWVQTQVEELLLQVEQAEAEIETLQGSGKRKKSGAAAAGRLEELEHLNERRKWHISRLEIIRDYWTTALYQRKRCKGCGKMCPILWRTTQMKTLTKTKVFTMSLISMRRRRSLVWRMMTIVMSRKTLVKKTFLLERRRRNTMRRVLRIITNGMVAPF